MIGRYRNPDGITNNWNVIIDPQEIDFNEFGHIYPQEIHVLRHRPGIGKTYNVMNFLKDKISKDPEFSFFFFTDRHEAISEHSKKLQNGSYTHWKGFSKTCISPKKITLYKCHIQPIDICKDCRKCGGYVSQFENNKKVFAPFNYLNSPHFKKNLPKIIFLDENIKHFESYSKDIANAKKLFEFMNRNDLNELIDQDNRDGWRQLEKEINHKNYYEEYKSFIIEKSSNRTNNK
jgi:hypothetical protein